MYEAERGYNTEKVVACYRKRLEDNGFVPERMTAKHYPKVAKKLGWSEGTYKTALNYLSEVKGASRGLRTPTRDYLPTDEEVRVVIKHFGPLGILLTTFGFRANELYSMYLEGSVLVVKTFKGGNILKIPVEKLAPRLREAIYSWVTEMEDYPPRQFKYEWEKLQAAGKLSKSCLRHSFRHRAITQWVKSGLSLAEVAKLVGHVDPKSTARYFHTTDDERADSYNLAFRNLN